MLTFPTYIQDCQGLLVKEKGFVGSAKICSCWIPNGIIHNKGKEGRSITFLHIILNWGNMGNFHSEAVARSYFIHLSLLCKVAASSHTDFPLIDEHKSSAIWSVNAWICTASFCKKKPGSCNGLSNLTQIKTFLLCVVKLQVSFEPPLPGLSPKTECIYSSIPMLMKNFKWDFWLWGLCMQGVCVLLSDNSVAPGPELWWAWRLGRVGLAWIEPHERNLKALLLDFATYIALYVEIHKC